MGFHALFAIEVPEVFGEGDEGAEHSALEASQVCGSLLCDVPGVARP